MHLHNEGLGRVRRGEEAPGAVEVDAIAVGAVVSEVVAIWVHVWHDVPGGAHEQRSRGRVCIVDQPVDQALPRTTGTLLLLRAADEA